MREMASSAERVAVIGAGHVGATAAYALMLRALFREIVLVDNDMDRAAAEARDIADANALALPAQVWAGGYRDAAFASIAVITAGAATHGSETRLSVAARSAAIVSECTYKLISAGFDGIILVASNPVDLMTMVALEIAGFPPGRVIGTGTLLDSSRLRTSLSQQLAVAPSAVDALVLGEHGDSEVVLFSTVRIGGIPLAEFSPTAALLDQHETARAVRDAGYEIIAGKGHTSFGVATAIVRICEAIVRDEKAVLPVSSLQEGSLSGRPICMSMPCIVSAAGVTRVLGPAMSDEETKLMSASRRNLRGAYDELQLKRPEAGTEERATTLGDVAPPD